MTLRTAAFALALVGAAASSNLEFDVGTTSCQFSFSGTDLTTNCAVGTGFHGKTGAFTASMSRVEFALGGSSCIIASDGTEVSTNCKLGPGFTSGSPSSLRASDSELHFESNGAKCTWSFDGTQLDTDCVLGSGIAAPQFSGCDSITPFDSTCRGGGSFICYSAPDARGHYGPVMYTPHKKTSGGFCQADDTCTWRACGQHTTRAIATNQGKVTTQCNGSGGRAGDYRLQHDNLHFANGDGSWVLSLGGTKPGAKSSCSGKTEHASFDGLVNAPTEIIIPVDSRKNFVTPTINGVPAKGHWYNGAKGYSLCSPCVVNCGNHPQDMVKFFVVSTKVSGSTEICVGGYSGLGVFWKVTA